MNVGQLEALLGQGLSVRGGTGRADDGEKLKGSPARWYVAPSVTRWHAEHICQVAIFREVSRHTVSVFLRPPTRRPFLWPEPHRYWWRRAGSMVAAKKRESLHRRLRKLTIRRARAKPGTFSSSR